MKKCVIFPASMKNVGLLYHFTELSIAMWRAFKDDDSMDLFILSENGEQNPGLWKKLNTHLPASHVLKYKSSKEFPNFVRDKLVDPQYEKVIYLTQGIMQFLEAITLKRKNTDNIRIKRRIG